MNFRSERLQPSFHAGISLACALALFLPAGLARAASKTNTLTSKQTFSKPVKASPPLPFATTAPEFVLSGRAAEMEKVILAQTPAGPVTALDVALFDQMNDQRLWATPVASLIDPKTLEAEDDLPAIRAVIDQLAESQSLAARAANWAAPEDELRVMSYPAAEAAYLDQQVVPEVKVEEADIHRYYLEHANDYLRRRQAQVRYIFKRVDAKDGDRVATLTTQLEALATQVRAKTRDFEQAARELSDAPSKADGGLIPPFYDSKYFPAFDQNAFSLVQPGDLSPVFQGPGGLYLMQLVQSFPTRDIPLESVHDTISAELAHDHVRHYYAYSVSKLKDDASIRDFSQWWPYLNPDAPIAVVGNRQLARQDFMRFFGSPTDLDLNVHWDVVGLGTRTWTEGEVIYRELEKKGGFQHKWIARSRELATISLRAKRALAAEVPPASYTTAAAATATLDASDALANDFKAYHLLQISITPQNNDKMTAADQREAERLVESLEDRIRRGVFPVDPTPINLAEWRDDAVTSGGLSLKNSIQKLNKAATTTAWPNVKIQVADFGWSSPLIDSPLYRLLSGVDAGDFSRTQEVGQVRVLYLALETKPSISASWKDHPEALREMAYQAGTLKLRAAERDRLAAQGSIRYLF